MEFCSLVDSLNFPALTRLPGTSTHELLFARTIGVMHRRYGVVIKVRVQAVSVIATFEEAYV